MKKNDYKDRKFHLDLVINGTEATILIAALRAYLDHFSKAVAAPEIEGLMWKAYHKLMDQAKLVPDDKKKRKP